MHFWFQIKSLKIRNAAELYASDVLLMTNFDS